MLFRFIKNKSTRPKSGYPQGKKPGNTIFDSESIATITDLPLPCNKSDVEAFLDDLFDRALDPKSLAKKKNKSILLSTLDQRRLQMISNSRVDPSARRRGLTNLLQKKSSSINEQNGTKKKIKTDKKRTTKSKKKRHEQLNINNNNNNNSNLLENSFTSFTNENDFILPQVGYSSRIENYIYEPNHETFYRDVTF